MGSWLENAVADVLQKVLGTFIKGIDRDSLNLSVWNGDVRLRGLELRTEVLEALQIPVHVLGASLGEVRVKVPWRNIGKEPLLITLDTLLVLVSPKGEDQPEDETPEEAVAKAKAKRDLAEASEAVESKNEAGKQARSVAALPARTEPSGAQTSVPPPARALASGSRARCGHPPRRRWGRAWWTDWYSCCCASCRSKFSMSTSACRPLTPPTPSQLGSPCAPPHPRPTLAPPLAPPHAPRPTPLPTPLSPCRSPHPQQSHPPAVELLV